MTVAVTACWVEADGSFTPYPDKFPDQAKVLKWWAKAGVIEIASHGLTHCIPRWHQVRWRGNRMWHRESWQYCIWSKRYLEEWVEQPITTLVPPGLQFPPERVDDALALGFKTVILKPDPCVVWHDREFVLDPSAMERFRFSLMFKPYRSVREWSAAQAA